MTIGTDGAIGKDPNSSTSQVITIPTISGGTIEGTTIGAITAVIIRSKFNEDVEPASDTLTANQCSGGVINNYGQVNDATLIIDAAVEGGNFVVLLGTTVAKYFRLDPVANDSVFLDGTTTGDGKYIGIASAVKGAAISFVAFQTGAASWDWYASTISGVWVAEV